MREYDEINKRLNAVFCDIFEDESIAIFNEMTAANLEDWDSFAHITLVLAIEKEFGLTLNAEEIGDLSNVGAMIDLLRMRATK